MQNDILFDNIYIGHSVEDARTFAEETFFKKITVEKAQEQAEKPKAEDKPKSLADLKFTDDPVTYVKEKLDLFLTIAAKSPVDAIKFVPEVPAAVGAVLLLLIGGIVALTSAAPKAPAPKKKAEKESKGKDKAEASTTGADAGKEGVTKRTTRSQS